jgi:cell fate (sporulation/competence/biofilm development) regulator YlbF (YheA/YmcA/DUF963 family)
VLHIDEKLFAIDEEIDKLVEEILKSEQVESFRVARHDFQTDLSLNEEVTVLNDNLDYINFRKDLKELQKKINLNPKVYALRLAENDLQELLSEYTREIVTTVSEHINIDENLPLKGGHNHHDGRKKSSR